MNMTRFLAVIPLLSYLFQQSLASPLHLQQRDSINNFASVLIVTATTGDLPVVTFYPSSVTDSSLWTLSTPTTITSLSSSEVVGPLGLEWVASPSPSFIPPAIPPDAPYPRPSNSTAVPPTKISAKSLGSGSFTGPVTSIPFSPSPSSVLLGTGPNTIPPPIPSSSISSLASIHSVTRFSIPQGTGASLPSSILPGTGVSSSATLSHTSVSASNSTSLGTDISSSNINPPTGVSSSNSVPPGTGISRSSIASSNDISSSTSIGIGVTSSNPLPPSSLGLTSSLGSSSPPISGIFSATPTAPTEAFPSYDGPTGVVTGAAATSEAAQLSKLFFAIYVNRDQITDPDLKQEYIDDVKKTKEETDLLFNALNIKLDPPSECLSTKRKRFAIPERKLRLINTKRSLISGFTDLVGDAFKLLSCAKKVVDNLVEAVEADVPPIPEIETLTDTLNEIAEDLQNEDTNPSNSPSESHSSSTATSSASSCTASSAIPKCTATITLSTSFLSGTTGISTVQSITTEVCTTITTCNELASTAFTTVSTATSTGGIVCATDCAACANPIVKRDNSINVRDLLEERSLADPDDFDSANQYVLDQIENFPGVEELDHKQTGRLSSALTKPFEKTPLRLYVAGLFGCTSVVIVSEQGVWFSHHWEAPSFEGDDARFEREVLSTIRDGDPDDPVRMPGPSPLAEVDGILNPTSNVQIFISTPKSPVDGKELFEARIDEIVDLLTGEGKPWAGITPTRRGYLKPTSQRERDAFALRANSKVLIEYDNNQEAQFGEEPKPNQQAIYRVWLEQEKFEHQWDAKPNIQKDAACSNTNRKRQDGGSCSQPVASSATSKVATASPTGSITEAAPPPSTGSATELPTPSPDPAPVASSTAPSQSTSTPTESTPPAEPTPSPTESIPTSTSSPPTTTQPASPPTTTQPAAPDPSSPACLECGTNLGASNCKADDGQCLVDQCKNDTSCQACGLDCNQYA